MLVYIASVLYVVVNLHNIGLVQYAPMFYHMARGVPLIVIVILQKDLLVMALLVNVIH